MRKMVVSAVVAAGISLAAAAVQAQAPAQTVWNGVFTTDQAASGKAVYDASCAMCHGADLGGNEAAPALTGADFLGKWATLTIGDLASRIHTTMPQNDPGTLNNKQVADVAAYILSANQLPPGTVVLPDDPALQGQITIVADKPAGK